MALRYLILMTNVTSSDGLMVLNTEIKCKVQMASWQLILMTMVTSSDSHMEVYTDDKCDQFIWPHGS